MLKNELYERTVNDKDDEEEKCGTRAKTTFFKYQYRISDFVYDISSPLYSSHVCVCIRVFFLCSDDDGDVGCLATLVQKVTVYSGMDLVGWYSRFQCEIFFFSILNILKLKLCFFFKF